MKKKKNRDSIYEKEKQIDIKTNRNLFVRLIYYYFIPEGINRGSSLPCHSMFKMQILDSELLSIVQMKSFSPLISHHPHFLSLFTCLYTTTDKYNSFFSSFISGSLEVFIPRFHSMSCNQYKTTLIVIIKKEKNQRKENKK